MLIKRRDLLSRSAAGFAALSAAPPLFLSRSAMASEKKSDGRILVVVEMAGGNDGLNTVIPHGDPLYKKNRPSLAVAPNDALKLDGYSGLHPRMTGFKSLFDEGRLAVVQGVGYPNPNRSHFRSMDIWQSGKAEEEYTQDGWLGRSLDIRAEQLYGKTPAMGVGAERLPLALLSRKLATPVIESLSSYNVGVGPGTFADHRRAAMGAMAPNNTGPDDLSFLRRTAHTAYATADRLKKVASEYKAAAEYPQSHLAQSLKLIAQMIAADLGTEIFYVSQGSYDTHSQQQNLHAGLVGELSDGVTAFLKDIAAHKLDDRVLVMTFSEFGRRLKENGSLGTDHGAASQLFVVRPKGWKSGKAGLVGKHPSLSDLDNEGDLKHHTDFRSVYASILDTWLRVDSTAVLGKKWQKVECV
jgi:uncharacterized protein (DUF1501 family)